MTPNQTSEGLVMWWAFIITVVLVYPAVEMVEEWRLHRAAEKQVTEMRKHAASGHKWDVTRGQWAG
jgi:hypothetical protein